MLSIKSEYKLTIHVQVSHTEGVVIPKSYELKKWLIFTWELDQFLHTGIGRVNTGGRTHLQKHSLQILDLQGLAFPVIKSYLIFQESFLPQPLCTLPPITGFTLIQYILSLFALLQCTFRCMGDEASGDRVGGHIAKNYSLQYVPTPEVSIFFLYL